METFDVVIVGARCGGSATGRLLAQAGLRVLLVDRATFPSDTESTHSITGHGTRLLQHWGLFDRLVALGTPNPREMTVRLGDVELPRIPSEPHTPGAFAPRRTVLDAVLVEVAQDAGATLWDHTACESVRVQDDRVVGVTVRRGDRSVDVRAGLVIGADGAHSTVARQVAAPTYRSYPSDMAAVYAYFGNTGLDHPHLLLTDRRLTLAFATNDDQMCVAVGRATADVAEIVGVDDAGFCEAVRPTSDAVADAIAAGNRVGRYHVFRPQPSAFRVPYGPGWALVGDAGHYTDPVTGHGIADAFLCADLLADAVVHGNDLRTYQEQRDALLTEIHDVTGELSQMRWSNDDVLACFGRYRASTVATLDAVDRRIGYLVTT